VRTYTLLEAVPLFLFAAIGFISTCAAINEIWQEYKAKKRRDDGARLILQFRSSKEPPIPAAGEDDIYCEYLLWNQCDGFHIASVAEFEDGKFMHFGDFMGSYTWGPNDFQAWAPLPEVGDFAYRALHREFHVNMNCAPEATHEN